MTSRLISRGPLVVEACLALSLATLAIRVLPSSRTTRMLGSPTQSRQAEPPHGTAERARRIGRVVERVAERLPWKPLCLPQAIATRWLLRLHRIECRSHLGVIQTAPLSTHAWITVGAHIVQGGPASHATEIAAFR